MLDVVGVPVPPCATTLDHVATTPDITGPCDTLGEAPGDSARIDGGGGMDHRGIFCVLSVSTGRATAPPVTTPVAAPPVSAPPAQRPSVERSAAGRSLAATGPAPLAAVAVLLLTAAVGLRRRRSTVTPRSG